MSTHVVVVGAGYAGTGLVQALEGDPHLDLTWISDRARHVVKHEVHRIIRSPTLANGLAIPISRIRSPETSFREERVVAVNRDRQTIDFADGGSLSFDYLALTVGANTAYYGIPGLNEHAYTVTGIEDTLALREATMNRVGSGPIRIIIGGGGLSGVQVAGELHDLAQESDFAVTISIVEALDDILPNASNSLQARVTASLERRDISTLTRAPIVEASTDRVITGDEDELPADIIVWTGGITGGDITIESALEHARNRISADEMLRTSDPRIFALGDAAIIQQHGVPAPPTAQAAWQAAPIAAANIKAAVTGKPLTPWEYESKGTLVSIGDVAVAHGIPGVPRETFDSFPAAFLKKAVAARWIASVDSWRHAASLWSDL